MSFLKRFLLSFLWLSFGVFLSPCIAQDTVEFFVLVCSYNNAKWIEKNLESVFCQTYPNWTIYYVDDCSTDGTGDLVKKYIEKRGFSDKCTVVCNETNQKTMANYYYAISKCDPHKVVVNLDGDDWLAHDKVLEKLGGIYKDPNIWMTYGSFWVHPNGWRGCAAPFPEKTKRDRSFRKYKWVLSHLRTYYAALFQKIEKEDLFYKGKFFPAATDVAHMFPIIEMAGNNHFLYINEILYIYNYGNPLSVCRRNAQVQLDAEAFIRSKPSYKPLEKLF